MKPFSLAFLALFTLVFISSCQDEEPIGTIELMVPETYNFLRDGESTVSFIGQTTRIGMAEETVDGMKEPSRTLESLNNMFRNPEGIDPFASAELNEATKSVRSKVAASQDLFSVDAVRAAEVKADFDGWLEGQTTEVFPNWNELAAPGQAGQIADGSSTRYVNAWGLEYNQAFAKSLIGGLMLDQINNNYLSLAVLDAATSRADNDAVITETEKPYTYMEHRWDEAFGYLFGASATPSTPLSDVEIADNFLNKYLGRVENDVDYTGIAASIEAAFRTGRQAIVEGAYAERDEQAGIIQANLEKVIAIRAVYYLKQGEANLRSQPAQLGSAFHDLSEGYGFIYSLRFFQTRGSDAVIDYYPISESYLERLRNANGNGFWDVNPDELANMAQEIADLAGITVDEAGS